MCGIIGRIGEDNCVKYILDGLKLLEYRGYDSSGIAVLSENGIKTVKAEGRIGNLEIKDDLKLLNGFVGIGHTRWATHGRVNEQNAHPHMSFDGKFTVVHNGIIENSNELYKEYLKGINPVSDTDTEVIAHLLAMNYSGDALKAISETLRMLKGSYALGILCSDTPDVLYCAAHSSPLVFAKGDSGCFIASDVSAVAGCSNTAVSISNGDIAAVSKDGISLYDKELNAKTVDYFKIDSDNFVGDKQGYEHYMMLEIMEQPDAVRKTVLPLIKDEMPFLPCKSFAPNIASSIKEVVIIACGSAYHTGLVGKKAIEGLCRIPCRTEIASEFRYADPIIDKDTLAVFISQSGETADTLAALRLAKKLGAQILSIVNVRGSAIAKESDNVIYTNAGREIAVATTKAYSAQLSVLYILALYIAKSKGTAEHQQILSMIKEIRCLPEKIQIAIDNNKETAKRLSEEIKTLDDIYFIGRQTDYAVAAEASLKMKEISYIHSEAYAAGELKHGTISLISDGVPVIAIASSDGIFEKTMSNLCEVESRGAKTILVTTEKYRDKASDDAVLITVPDAAEIFAASVLVPPLQLLSYYTAKARGCDIDKPKNLAKSVTVE